VSKWLVIRYEQGSSLHTGHVQKWLVVYWSGSHLVLRSAHMRVCFFSIADLSVLSRQLLWLYSRQWTSITLFWRRTNSLEGWRWCSVTLGFPDISLLSDDEYDLLDFTVPSKIKTWKIGFSFCPQSNRFEWKWTCWSSCWKGYYGKWSINGPIRHSACYQGSRSGKGFMKGLRVHDMTRLYEHQVEWGVAR
jgi:hypothetical protein